LIDYFSLALTHGLILVAVWRLAFRPELDVEEGQDNKRQRPWNRSRTSDEGRSGDA